MSPNKHVTLCSDLMIDLLLPRINHMYTTKKNLQGGIPRMLRAFPVLADTQRIPAELHGFLCVLSA